MFQGMLIISGNLSFLNWLTIAPALACFDDHFLCTFVPRSIREKITLLVKEYEVNAVDHGLWKYARILALTLVAALVAYLSWIGPVQNLMSSRQAMNRSFDRFDLVNTYGAFGTVGKERYEVILQGTNDTEVSKAKWYDYNFKCKPGDVTRRPCVIAPYQLRIDWQIWFAAMQNIQYQQ